VPGAVNLNLMRQQVIAARPTLREWRHALLHCTPPPR
jgi:hypothetical protein